MLLHLNFIANCTMFIKTWISFQTANTTSLEFPSRAFKQLKVGTHLYIHVHNSITDNSQKLKAVQVSVDRGIRKTNLAYIYKYTHTYTHTHNHTHTTHKGILFSLKGKEIPHATTRMNLEDIMLVK